jgi:hypothetical protein
MPKSRSKPDRKWLEAYAFQSERCAVCWWRKYRPGKRCELHHIVGRRGRDPHHHRNLILVCEECHRAYHAGISGKPLTLGHILKAKEEEDGEVDLEFLAGLKGRAGLKEDPTELPEWVHEERRRNAEK